MARLWKGNYPKSRLAFYRHSSGCISLRVVLQQSRVSFCAATAELHQRLTINHISFKIPVLRIIINYQSLFKNPSLVLCLQYRCASRTGPTSRAAPASAHTTPRLAAEESLSWHHHFGPSPAFFD
jgi:hypothetical protein